MNFWNRFFPTPLELPPRIALAILRFQTIIYPIQLESQLPQKSPFNLSSMHLLNIFFPFELIVSLMCSRLWIKLPYVDSESSLPSSRQVPLIIII